MAVAYKSLLGRFFGIDLSTGDLVGKDGVPVVRSPDNNITNVTASTLTVTRDLHDGKTITLNRAAGIAVTLPAATGTGAIYTFFVGTTVTSNTTTIKVADATDTMSGIVLVNGDTAANAAEAFGTAATDDTITLNGSTTGGLKGDWFILQDVASDLYSVRGAISATGTEATPFSATVS